MVQQRSRQQSLADEAKQDTGSSVSSLKSIANLIESLREKNIPKVADSPYLEKGPAPIINIDPKMLEEKGPAPTIPFDPKEGIELLAPKKRYMINGMPTTEEVDRIFTQKFERLTDEGKMMFQMLFEKNPDAGAETILDLIMKRPEFLSGEETVGDMLEERTQSKANGGIVSLFGNM